MIVPVRSEVQILRKDDQILIARCEAFDITMLNNTAAVLTAGYSVGSFQYIDKKTALSTGVIKAVVSNDPNGDVFVAHPTATSISAPGASAGVALEHTYFGAQVTTIQGTAGDSSVLGELWICLKA